MIIGCGCKRVVVQGKRAVVQGKRAVVLFTVPENRAYHVIMYNYLYICKTVVILLCTNAP